MSRTIVALVRPTALAITLAGCVFGIRDRAAIRFIGRLVPVDAAQCPPSTGVLVMRDAKFTFAPDEGTWVLAGAVGTDTLAAKRSRPTSNHKSYDTELQAKWTENAVTGTYTTPQCTYQVSLEPR